ncbi:MAG: prephenate dehydrogenase/arogenate dehydrogenase family protein [Herminiimonas sp.]|nr:prephenate dehydrogenase/arogenate dehydrogenase family protein [Herminiimonas sp.]
MFRKITIVGVGLIGGSFALALKKAQGVEQVMGVGRSPEVLARAAELGIVDCIARSMEEAVDGADLVLIATPVAQTGAILGAIAPFLQPQTIVTDAGSTKGDVVTAARLALGSKSGQFVPGHPIAGRESNGPEAALADLYVGKKVVLTPLPENSAEVIERVASAWSACGAIVHRLSASQHDRIFAAVSHLPHLLAYALVDQIEQAPEAELLFQYAASGFRDFTRIAGSSPEMWRDIALANRSALLSEIERYSSQLARLKTMLAVADGDGLHALFANAQRARQAWQGAIEAAEKQSKTGGD